MNLDIIATNESLPFKGEMQTITLIINDSVLMKTSLDEKEIKNLLIKRVAEALMNSRYVSFMKSHDPNYSSTSYKARFCLVPAGITQEIYKAIR